jgi:hypothetical protein
VRRRAQSPPKKAARVLDIVRLVKAVLDLLINLGPTLRVLFVEPLITVAMLLFLYAGWHVRDEGSIAAGLRVAFVDTKAFRAEHLRELETALLQTQLHQASQTDHLINQLLGSLLEKAPSVARVRLDVVHNGVTGVTGTALLRYDVTNSVAARGHSPGPLLSNQPLSDWDSFLPTLLADKCDVALVDQTPNISFRARLESLGASAFMACPVIDVQNRMMGAVILQWDEHDTPPGGDSLRTLMDDAKGVGNQIASALDLRAPLPYPYPGAPE